MNERIPSEPPLILPVPPEVHRPLWSVMIPTYNCSQYLAATLQSVLVQDPGTELMQIAVVDDCSTDADVEALVAAIGKGRIEFYRQPENRGSLRNFETCLNRARGKLIHLLHGDDMAGEGLYTVTGALFEQYPQAGAVCTGFSYIDEKGEYLYTGNVLLPAPGIINDWLPAIAQQQKLQPPAVVVRRAVYEHLGGFFGIHYGEDWEMWVRIAAHYAVAYTPQLLAAYRVHTTNITSRYFQSCQHIKDIVTVINTIQPYLPVHQQRQLKRKAQHYWSLYFARTSDMTYHKYNSPRQALEQAVRSFLLHQNRVTAYFVFKMLLKLLIRYKQGERK
jgi:glycosyltransferase involved in cell wall biosynthesis